MDLKDIFYTKTSACYGWLCMPVERVNGSLVSSRLSVLKWPFFHTIFSYMDLLRLEKWFAVGRRTIRPVGLHED